MNIGDSKKYWWIGLFVVVTIGVFLFIVSDTRNKESTTVEVKNPETGTPMPAPKPEGDNPLVDSTWMWKSATIKSSDTIITVLDSENYTLIFKDDGTFTGKADCNNIAGTYTSETGFTLSLGPSTLAFCGEDSLDQQYIELLSGVVAGGPDGAGGLALEWPAGEKRMEFVK